MSKKLILGFALAALLALSLMPGTASAASNCYPQGSKGIVRIASPGSAGSVRVFKLRTGSPAMWHTYVCSLNFNTRIRLHEGDFPGSETNSRFAIAGRFIAYVHRFSCGACEGLVGAFVYVVDLKYRNSSWQAPVKYLSADTLADCPRVKVEECPAVYVRLLLRPTAAFAVSYSVAPQSSNGTPTGSPINVIEKHVLGAGLRSESIAILDRVPAADLSTLAMSSTTLTWMNAGMPKTATIP